MAASAALRAGSGAMAALGRRLSVGGVRSYNARPLRRQLGGVYRPDPASPRTPAWQLEPAYEARLYGRHGAASGVDPARLWPGPRQLAELEAEEEALCPALREVEAALDAKEREVRAQRRSREEVIAAQMAKMPQMILDWQRQREENRIKRREEKERRQRLLAEAREKFGHTMDHRSAKFQEMVQEMEKTRKKELKLQKKQRREQALAKKAAEAAKVASLPAKEEEAEVATSSSQVT